MLRQPTPTQRRALSKLWSRKTTRGSIAHEEVEIAVDEAETTEIGMIAEEATEIKEKEEEEVLEGTGSSATIPVREDDKRGDDSDCSGRGRTLRYLLSEHFQFAFRSRGS